MKHGKTGNNLVIIEAGNITAYPLDNRNSWEVGRPSESSNPDIKLNLRTVSRKHGKFQNMDGVWFYLDYNGKNGTVYNKKHIKPGINGRVKPAILNNGDVFVFGGAEEEIISGKTIFALFLTKQFDEDWRVIDSKGCSKIRLNSEESERRLLDPEKGTVVELEDGVAIYMGDNIYAIGDVNITCEQ